QMADMRAIGALAERHSLQVVEDACQAHGGERDGIRAGTAGIASAFSFYPAKNLGAAGDAGALTTNDVEVERIARALRTHGEPATPRAPSRGHTARLDTVQAIILGLKLPLLDGWNAERAHIASLYDHRLADVGDLRLPPRPAESRHVWHLYVVRTARRDELR